MAQRMVEKPKAVDDDQSVALWVKCGFVSAWLRKNSHLGMTKNRMNAARLCGSHPLGYGYSLLDKSGSLAWQTRYITMMLMLENAARLKVGNDRGMVIFGLVSRYSDTPALCWQRCGFVSGRPSRGVPNGSGRKILSLGHCWKSNFHYVP